MTPLRPIMVAPNGARQTKAAPQALAVTVSDIIDRASTRARLSFQEQDALT